MRKLLLISTALVGFALVPDCAAAAPVGAWVATALMGAGAVGAIGFAVVSGVVTMAISVGIGLIAQKLRGKPKAEAIRQELTRPTSLPAYRFVYGKTWAPGTPVAWTVRGRSLYICYLLNSRPSAGPFTVLFDKREVEKAGNEFDFSAAGGAIGTNEPFKAGIGSVLPPSVSQRVTYWIGRGDQTTCPAAIVSETDGYFSTSDAWRGRTVLWARLDCGPDDERQERWPSNPPELNVDGNWSIVYDPRNGAEAFTRNQGLIVLDALRNNPMRPYGDDYLRMDTFGWAANVAAERVGVKAGGTIPRYQCDGILVFGDGAELEDQIQPLLDAGASRLTRVGGKLAIVPCAYRESVKTITDVTDGQPLDLVRWRSSDALFTEAVARYPAPDRAYESAETPAYIVPGAQAQDGGIPKRLTMDLDFVTDGRQAQRLAKIAAWRSRMQRQVSCEAFPDAFDLVAGSVCRLNLPAPYGPWNQKYEVESIAPTAGLADNDGITLRLPVALTETSDEITAWDPASEEQDIEPGSFGSAGRKVLPPPSISIVSGSLAAQVSGETTVPAILAYWPASASASTHGYEWEWGYDRQIESGEGGAIRWQWSGWRSGGQIANSGADEAGLFQAFVPWVQIGNQYRYRVRIRARGTYGNSDWRESARIHASGPEAVIAAPEITEIIGGAGWIDVTAQQSGDRPARELLIYVASADSPLTATLLWTVNAGANVSIKRRHSGLGSGVTRFYFARARDQWGNLSPFSAGASESTT